jgi:glycerol-3-phosphate dehydrogenase
VKETLHRLSTLNKENLKGGVVYHDGQFDDARLAVNLAQTCIENGATLLNHFKVQSLKKSSKGLVNGLVAIDQETQKVYDLKAKVVVNATGVFTDEVLKMDQAQAPNTIHPSQGIHLVFDREFLPGNDAIMIPKTDDGRVLFLVPWHNKVVMGTTDTLIDSHSLEPKPLEEEINFILQTANRYLNKKVQRSDVRSIFAGLRPLAAPKDGNEKTKEISRSHKIIVSPSELVTITGGKWTTYRKMAQDTINKIIALKKLPPASCKTTALKIHGANGPIDIANHLYIYGTDKKFIEQLYKEDSSLKELLHPRLPYTKAEVVFAVRNEMARTLEDVLARRVRVLFLDASAAIDIAEEVAQIIGRELKKDTDWEAAQVASFKVLAQQYLLK